MASEIERKFLLAHQGWREEVSASERITQGYLSRGANAAVRVRLHGDAAELNVKSTRDGIHRQEYEYPIPVADAEQMLESVALRPLIDKTRHLVRRGGHLWEIDEFHGENAGLIVAEIELAHADEPFARPDWLGEEVSTDARYYNSSLSERPYTTW
ncbi:MAG: CYTH domain-containing protein [Gammaproteobacteria bacterium]|jgi:adenylate cyclase